MYLKDLLNDKQEEKDVGVLLDKGMFNLLSHITQTALFSTNPWTVLEDINRKKNMKNMKKDKFASTIFLTTKDIRDKGKSGCGACSYSIDLFKIAFEEASKEVGKYQIFVNKVYFNVLRNTVDFCFGIKDVDENRYDRDIKSWRVNLTFYRVRIVFPDSYEMYGVQNNIRWTDDAEYMDEYAIYDNLESFKYSIFIRKKFDERVKLINSIHLNSEYEEIPDTYELSGEDEDEN